MSHADWWFAVDVAKAAGVWALVILGVLTVLEDRRFFKAWTGA